MMWYIEHAITVIIGIGCYELINYLLTRWRMPYRWKCPQCNFSIKTSNQETYEISRSSHNHSRLREFRPQ